MRMLVGSAASAFIMSASRMVSIGHVGFTLDLGIDRDEEVLAVDLQAVTGIIDEGDRVLALLGHGLREVAQRATHAGLGEVGDELHFETRPRRAPQR